MKYETWCVVVISFCWLHVDALDNTCDYDYSEKVLLKNIDKLLNQTKVKIVQGVVLRKKSEDFHLMLRSNGSACENLLEVVQNKASTIFNTHVLEFDLASITKGNEANTFFTSS
jgi:hypothetical protein